MTDYYYNKRTKVKEYWDTKYRAWLPVPHRHRMSKKEKLKLVILLMSATQGQGGSASMLPLLEMI